MYVHNKYKLFIANIVVNDPMIYDVTRGRLYIHGWNTLLWKWPDEELTRSKRCHISKDFWSIMRVCGLVLFFWCFPLSPAPKASDVRIFLHFFAGGNQNKTLAFPVPGHVQYQNITRTKQTFKCFYFSLSHFYFQNRKTSFFLVFCYSVFLFWF